MADLDTIVDNAIVLNHVITSAIYGQVYRYGDYCIKSYRNAAKGKHVENIDNEAAIMKKIQCSGREFPNIPKYYGLVTREVNTYIITEYINGHDVYYYIDNHKDHIPEDFIVDVIRTITQILIDLREIDIAHMDISIENIIIAKTGKIYLIDFGMACSYERAYEHTKELLFGKPMYNEIDIPVDPEKRQVYMMAIVMHTMLYRFQPYQNYKDHDHVAFTKTPGAFMRRIERMAGRNISRPLMRVFHKMIVKNLQERYTFAELLQNLPRREDDLDKVIAALSIS